jgi:hypothetical protein
MLWNSWLRALVYRVKALDLSCEQSENRPLLLEIEFGRFVMGAVLRVDYLHVDAL